MAPDDRDREELALSSMPVTSRTEHGALGSTAPPSPLLGPSLRARPERPDLRRPRRQDVAILRVRVDLDDARPPIWRTLDLRSDLTLDVVHQVLQVAFGWTDSHLHRFALGGHPFKPGSQLFLCPFDVEEGEDDGIPASKVRLDETLQEPGDELRYIYDYGDSWELTLRLEDLLPAAPDAPTATCVDGERAAPPEDSGGITDEKDLARVLEDPAHFERDEINRALRGPYFVLREAGVHPRLVALLSRLRSTPLGDDLAARVLELTSPAAAPTPDEMTAAFAAHLWFLDHAGEDGLELTPAGYLKPADVEAAARVVPTMADWYGKNNRENLAVPLLRFRQSLQALGLLRKSKGRLLLTRAGAALRGNPARLWQHLASRLVPAAADAFDLDATLLFLAYAATSADASLPPSRVAEAMNELGWRFEGTQPVEWSDLYELEALQVLWAVSERPVTHHDRYRISPVAATLARAALMQGGAGR